LARTSLLSMRRTRRRVVARSPPVTTLLLLLVPPFLPPFGRDFGVVSAAGISRQRPAFCRAGCTRIGRRSGRRQLALPLRIAGDENEKDDDDDDDGRELFRKLDESFRYEGRMTGGTVAYGDDDGNNGRNYRCGFVSILGAPNMGKSTLLNALLEERLCIATSRPQTTRHAILGLLTTDSAQVCLVDTPGIIEDPAYRLQEGMMEAVAGAYRDADVLLIVTDLFSTPIPDDALFRKVRDGTKPVVVCVNKVDLASKVNADSPVNRDKKSVTVEQAVQLWRRLLPNAFAIIPTAASNGPDDAGVAALRKLLVGGPDVPAAIRDLGRPIEGMFLPGTTKFVTDEQARGILPTSPPLYDPDILTDRPERFIASEMIRAALFETLKKELPYCCEVQITKFTEPPPPGPPPRTTAASRNDGSDGEAKQANEKAPQKCVIRIEALVLVERDSQKQIVIGKGGEQIKRVGILAREKLEDFFQTQVSTSRRQRSPNSNVRRLRFPKEYLHCTVPIPCHLPFSHVPFSRNYNWCAARAGILKFERESEQRLEEEQGQAERIRVLVELCSNSDDTSC